MKKIIATLLCFMLLLQFSLIAVATDGDPNIDGGGGGTEDGTGTNKWTPGGQMFVYGDDALTIRDGTYFDDWHIAPKLVRE